MQIQQIGFRVGIKEQAPIESLVSSGQALGQKLASRFVGPADLRSGVQEETSRRDSNVEIEVQLFCDLLTNSVHCVIDRAFFAGQRH